MITTRKFILSLAALAVSGCASMSSEECTLSDWQAIGYTDGARGLPVSQFDSYRKDCAAHGVAPGFDSYRSGRDEGLREFCQPERAFDLGNRGARNPGVCPPESSAEFAQAFADGRHLFELRSSLQRVQRQLTLKDNRYHKIENDKQTLEASLVSKEPTVEERLQMLLELKNLAEEQQQLQAEMHELQSELDDRERALAAYQVALSQSL